MYQNIISLIQIIYKYSSLLSYGKLLTLQLNSHAKTPWSWGRMVDILSEGREIESCRQLEQLIEKRIGNGKTGAPVNDHRRASALENKTRSQARKAWTEQETWFEGCGVKREQQERRRGRTCKILSIQETRVAARNKGCWSSSSLDVTQAAGHKERWREQKKIIIIIPFILLYFDSHFIEIIKEQRYWKLLFKVCAIMSDLEILIYKKTIIMRESTRCLFVH